jgi:DNA-binding beta-propeller fold protein YncE
MAAIARVGGSRENEPPVGAMGVQVETLGGMRMKAWVLGAAIVFAVCVAGCGGNSTKVGVTITGPSSATTGFPVLLNGSVQLAATVSGITATTVYWQVCLPPSLSTAQPTNCTPGQGPSQCKIPAVSSPLTGYGTITPNGLYTAPAAMPSPNTALAVATSCVDSTAFGTFSLVIDSGFRVQITPTSATIATGQTFQFNATVKGPTTSSVTWAVCQTSTSGVLSCGVTGFGSISAGGAYTAPGTAPSGAVIVQATCVDDPTQTATATVTVAAAIAPTIASMDPTVAAAGSAQQDVYLTGTDFLSTEEVVVGPAAQAPTAVPTTFLSSTLLRATLPAAQLAQAGTLQVSVQTPDGNLSAPVAQTLTLFATKPALIASSPDSLPQSISGVGSFNVGLTGGFFSGAAANATTATFNGASVLSTISSSRQMSITVPATAIQTSGLYPIVLQNAGVVSGEPFLSGVNVAVTPPPTSIPTAPVATVNLAPETDPTAVAIDKADGIAVVANTGSNTVSLVNLRSNPISVTGTIAVGNQPTGVAVDDQLPDPVALVVNSADQSVTAVDLATAKSATLSVSISAGPNPPLPFAIGVNSMTPQPVPGVTPIVHRAIVAYQSTNQATVLDVSVVSGVPELSLVETIGSTAILPFSTGKSPAIGIDPRLNWAVITPGGSGTVGIVDLGRDAFPGLAPGAPPIDVGRAPEVIASLYISITVQGVGINPETHEVFLSDPQTGTLSTFNPLDDSVSTVTAPCGSPPCPAFDAANYGAAAVSPLENVGIAVGNGTAAVVDLESANVLQTVSGLGSAPAAQGVAVDPVSNRAIVVNSGDGTVSIISLGGAIDPVQVVTTSPAFTFTSSTSLPLTVTGGNFPSGSVVRLDQQALATTPVASTCTASSPVTCRQLSAMVPANMLGSARRYSLDVQGPTGAVSNVEDLTVIQPIPVGNTPVGVAVDADRDLAVVTNSGDGTASLVSLAANSPESPESLGPVGELPGSPVQVGASPEGVAVLPRLGSAVVANNGSNNVTVIDETGTVTPTQIGLCGASCTGPTGVAINPDTATAAVTNTNPGSASNPGSISEVALSSSASSGVATVDQDPVAVAVDPILNYAAVATASQASSIDFIDMSSLAKVGGITGAVQNPSGIVFDPINQVFLTADSLQNSVSIIDPATFIPTQVAVGIAPTSLDYNFQTSTLVTVNGPSHTMSIMAYVCPPTGSAPTCVGPRVRSVLGLGGSQTSNTVLGPNAVAIDPKLNLAALVDPDNNRVLLVPLPR